MTLSSGEHRSWRDWRREIAILLIAFAARAIVGLYLTRGDSGLRYPDEMWYWELAVSLRNGDGLVGEFGHRAERMPLYPAFLAIFADAGEPFFWARVAQWIVGAIGAVFVMRLGALIASPLVGVAAGLGYALDPGLCGSASLLLSETLFVSAMAALWWSAWPRGIDAKQLPLDDEVGLRDAGRCNWIVCALGGMACVMLRESSLLIVGALCAWLAIVGWRLGRRRLSIRGGLILAAVALSLAIWGFRNHSVLGEWRFLTTRGGISLYDGVRPGATGASDLGEIKTPADVDVHSELAWDRYFADQSYEAIRKDPLRIIKLMPIKLARTWNPLPNAGDLQSQAVRVLFGLWCVPLYVLAIGGIWSIRRNGMVLAGLLIPAVCISLTHSVYIGSLRYRLGAVPTLAILAALGLSRFLVRTRISRPSSSSH